MRQSEIEKYFISWEKKEVLGNKIKRRVDFDILCSFIHELDFGRILYDAVCYNDIEMVERLVNFGASMGYCNCSGETVLHIACKEGFYGIVKFLIDNGADISIKNNEGKDALYYVEKSNHKEIIKLLEKANKESINE